jgi:PRTRC genetic system protein E
MFKQLVPLLRQRSVLLTVTHLGEDEIRVNVIPKKLGDSENSALTTPMSFTGTADQLDIQLPDAIVSFVASHLELKNTLARAKEEMDAAAKAAQDEARNKAKINKKPSAEPAKKAEPVQKEEQKKESEPPRRPGLFDTAIEPQPADAPTSGLLAAAPTPADEEDEIIAEISEEEAASSESDEDEGAGEAA